MSENLTTASLFIDRLVSALPCCRIKIHDYNMHDCLYQMQICPFLCTLALPRSDDTNTSPGTSSKGTSKDPFITTEPCSVQGRPSAQTFSSFRKTGQQQSLWNVMSTVITGTINPERSGANISWSTLWSRWVTLRPLLYDSIPVPDDDSSPKCTTSRPQ